MDNVLDIGDVFYMTRIQKERLEDNVKEAVDIEENIFIDEINIERIKESAIILHPFPRNNEISVKIDNNKRAKYFKQVENGLYIRMALLKSLNDN